MATNAVAPITSSFQSDAAAASPIAAAKSPAPTHPIGETERAGDDKEEENIEHRGRAKTVKERDNRAAAGAPWWERREEAAQHHAHLLEHLQGPNNKTLGSE